MNGAMAIIRTLEQQGIETLFGYPGGCIMPLYDAMLESSIRHVLCRHEQAAALAADGFARVSGQLGVCVATSGPGATNLVTGVANANMDSIPMLIITGQVPGDLIGTDAFQETDVLGLTFGLCKHSYLIRDAEEIAETLIQAIQLATTGRPGPVWIDIPKDVLLQSVSANEHSLTTLEANTFHESLPIEPLQQAIEFIEAAKKPLIYSGGGVALSHSTAGYRQFIESTQIPQVTTLKGIGNAGKSQLLDMGMLGMHGSRAANEAVHEADLIIAMGVRFDDRATGKASEFAENAKIIHIDIDASEFHKNRRIDCPVPGSLETTIGRLNEHFSTPLAIDEWRSYCLATKQDKGFPLPPASQEQIQGPEFLSLLSEKMPEQGVIASDVGQHQMWIAQYMRFSHPNRHLSSSGLGTMGFGLPAAIGAQFAEPEQLIVNVTGDGSFMMNVQELATIKRYRLPVKIVVLDNQRLGMVRQQQSLFYQERYSEIDLSDNPDFAQVAAAFGIHARTIEHSEQMPAAIEELLAHPEAMLLHVCISPETNVWPIVQPGQSNLNMIETMPSNC